MAPSEPNPTADDTQALIEAEALPDPERHAVLLARRRAALAEYEAEHGAITEEELESVRAWLRRSGAR